MTLKSSTGTSSETLRSPALVSGSLRVTEPVAGRRSRRFSGTRLKAFLSAFLYWCASRLPAVVSVGAGDLVFLLLGLSYWIPGTPMARGCRYMSVLSRRAGHHWMPGGIRRQFIGHAREMWRAYVALYRDGWRAVIGNIELTDDQRQRFREQIDQHGGLMMVVPHNFASAFSALKFSKAFPTLLTAKNSSSIARTRMALDFFERMDVKVLMVRDASRVQTSRTLLRALRSGEVVAATTDSVMGERLGCPARIFGQQVQFPAWAARIACRVGAPILPVYVRCHHGRVVVETGDPIVTRDPLEATQHYVSFFERNILADPANWPFMMDKKWLRILRAAVQNGG